MGPDDKSVLIQFKKCASVTVQFYGTGRNKLGDNKCKRTILKVLAGKL
jgi:hypothetical protein